MQRLLAHSGSALANESPWLSSELAKVCGSHAKSLTELLSERNGFYSYGGALHVFPATVSCLAGDIHGWNSSASWRLAYQGLADGIVFFAEDVFGDQFGVNEGGVFRFQAETGERQFFASTIAAFVERITSESELETGWPLLQQWESENGTLPVGKRLIPRIPFVLGGEFQTGNLYPLEAAKAMRFYGDLASQLKSVPDGETIQLKVVD